MTKDEHLEVLENKMGMTCNSAPDHVAALADALASALARIDELEERLPPMQVKKPNSALIAEAGERLSGIPGVDAAFLSGECFETKVCVIVKEHGDVDRAAILEVEDHLANRFGFIELSVCAHQGRGFGHWEGLTRIPLKDPQP